MNPKPALKAQPVPRERRDLKMVEVSVHRSPTDESEPEGRTRRVPERLLRGDYHLQHSTNGHTLTSASRLGQQDPTHTCSLSVTMKRVPAFSSCFISQCCTRPTAISEKHCKGSQMIPRKRFYLLRLHRNETHSLLCGTLHFWGVFIQRRFSRMELLCSAAASVLLSLLTAHTHTHTCSTHPPNPIPTARPQIQASCRCHGNHFHPVSTSET